MATAHGPAPRLFSRGSWPEASRIADILRRETLGGALLLVATFVALVSAYSPSSSSWRVWS
jgi:NhaA family Na+:H+ antiporter